MPDERITSTFAFGDVAYSLGETTLPFTETKQ